MDRDNRVACMMVHGILSFVLHCSIPDELSNVRTQVLKGVEKVMDRVVGCTYDGPPPPRPRTQVAGTTDRKRQVRPDQIAEQLTI